MIYDKCVQYVIRGSPDRRADGCYVVKLGYLKSRRSKVGGRDLRNQIFDVIILRFELDESD